ncbi:hypothetical protein EQG49_12115 [Periweissella cryptocerci]|uniref:Uncharacterized protein n=1 Tax=Periweissella cryptocerci TaxID=2506420 RepID=A0A4V1AIY7_9LACO|nr:hypothetical protein [Periweissella cryptocerci]QBO37145.1 hypothetical protein EQG49_12115 [Periweissella cryptocerci]
MKISWSRKILITAIALLGLGTTTGVSNHYQTVEDASANLTKHVKHLGALKNQQFIGDKYNKMIITDEKVSAQNLKSGDAAKIKGTTKQVKQHITLINQLIKSNAKHGDTMQELIPNAEGVLTNNLIANDKAEELTTALTNAKSTLQNKTYDDYATANTRLNEAVAGANTQIQGQVDYLAAEKKAAPVVKLGNKWIKASNVNAAQLNELKVAIADVQQARTADDVNDKVDILHSEIDDTKELSLSYQKAQPTIQKAQTLANTSTVKDNEKSSLRKSINKFQTLTYASQGPETLTKLKDKISRVETNIQTRHDRAIAAAKEKVAAAERERVAAEQAAKKKAEKAAAQQAAKPASSTSSTVTSDGWHQAPAGYKYLKSASGCYYGQVKNPGNFSLISADEAYASYRPGHGNGSAKQ